MITITQIAAIKIKEAIAKQEKPEDVMLRIAFGGYG